MKKIIIFASGSGSNAVNIIRYFENSTTIEVAMVLTNNKEAGVIAKCHTLGVPCLVFSKRYYQNDLLRFIKSQDIDFIILAGFLWLVPEAFVEAYPQRIINIHPALLPKYGGKGMWGHHVHEAVHKNKDTMSGITIHFVDEHFDEGQHIFQAECQLVADDSPEMIAEKVLALEHAFYPKVIEDVILKG